MEVTFDREIDINLALWLEQHKKREDEVLFGFGYVHVFDQNVRAQ
jgi:hypothetical protein